jgi:hypothetical protein
MRLDDQIKYFQHGFLALNNTSQNSGNKTEISLCTRNSNCLKTLAQNKDTMKSQLNASELAKSAND